MVEPLMGWHHVHARSRRTAVDFAHEIDWLLTNEQSHYKNAPKIKIVVDQLNTHTFGSLYKAFPAPYAGELAKRIRFHFTPKHRSWLNIAEIGINILSKQCVDRRIPNIEMLNGEITAWEAGYNNQRKCIDRRFTTEDARVKLRRLYPVF